MKTYKHLLEVTNEMLACNDMERINSISPDAYYLYDLDELEKQATRVLFEEILSDFVDGEDSYIEWLVERFDLRELDQYLTDVFEELY